MLVDIVAAPWLTVPAPTTTEQADVMNRGYLNSEKFRITTRRRSSGRGGHASTWPAKHLQLYAIVYFSSSSTCFCFLYNISSTALLIKYLCHERWNRKRVNGQAILTWPVTRFKKRRGSSPRRQEAPLLRKYQQMTSVSPLLDRSVTNLVSSATATTYPLGLDSFRFAERWA